MGKKIFITGTSKGLGEALANRFAEKYNVVGLSRSNAIINGNYIHSNINLADLNAVNDFKFEGEEKEWVLINNAGSIGPIKKAGNQTKSEIADLMNINVSALCLLMDNFINAAKSGNKKGIIINISSGAGSFPIEGWALYCASKAAVDMYSKVVQQELKQDNLPISVFSVAPGVVDTPMQKEIRSAREDQFSRVEEFKEKKKNGELSNPKEVARKIEFIISNADDFQEVMLSVRNID